ncbi:MAG: collagen-like protein, partial [Eubacteriales bacterium]|nr:collagen-like protein [Eubacteriales bacterium]
MRYSVNGGCDKCGGPSSSCGLPASCCRGPRGHVGPTGPTGPTGPAGPGLESVPTFIPGAAYTAGETVAYNGGIYRVSRSNPSGFPGTSPDFTLLTVTGPTGPAGVQGPQGPVGAQGPAGP